MEQSIEARFRAIMWNTQDIAIFQFVAGVFAVAVGIFLVVRRQAIVARHRRRSEGRPVQAPGAYLVLGVFLVLMGVSQVVEAFL